MHDYQSLSHSRWDCKYHLVFIPQGRRKILFGKIRKYLGKIFHELAKYKSCKILEGHIMPDHVHFCIEIPPKYAVASIVGYLKGKSAIMIARQFSGKERNFNGEPGLGSYSHSFARSELNLGRDRHFWARGYSVSTVGFEVEKIRKYIRDQKGAERIVDDKIN